MAGLRSCCLLLALLGTFATAQKKTYKCDFETGLCNFLSHYKGNKVNWQIGKGQQNALDTGPSLDHTYGTANGSYLFVNVSLAKTNPVVLQTQIFKQDYCVRFFYHMYGADVGDFTVSAQSASSGVNYFYRSGSQGDRWKEAVFSVKRNAAMELSGYQVLFTAKHKRLNSVKGDIAIDDVQLTLGKCPDRKSDATSLCSFEESSCGYTVTKYSSDFTWYWSSSYDYRFNHFSIYPKSDHTLGTYSGGYFLAYWDGEMFGPSLYTTTVSSPLYDAPKQPMNCLHFYYYMDADSTSIIWGQVKEAYIQAFATFSTSSKIWITTKAKNTTNFHRQWLYAEGKVELKNAFKFEFVGGFQSKVAAALAIDDIKLVSGSCPDAGFCDFEESKCDWIDGDGDVIWIRKKGSSKTNGEIGPSSDKSSMNAEGHYLVLSTVNKEPGWTANLESDFFPPEKETVCLTFYYTMKGKNPGTLKVVRKEQNITETTLWVMKNEVQNTWVKGIVPLTPSSIYSQVVFRGIVGSGKNAYIALDDIRMRSGEKCDFSPSDADPRYEAITLLSCTFDAGNLCYWKQAADAPLSWKFGNGTLLESTGPQKPVNGRGSYIFVNSYEGDQSKNEKVAKIQSPVVSSFYPQPACFSFYYHMFGAHVGELRLVLVPMQDANTPLGASTIWRRRGTQPDKWMLLQDSLNLTEGDYRLEIVAEGGSGFAGDIAIDNMLMSIGACPDQRLCDFENDNLCGWTVEPNDKGTFFWQTGSDLVKGPDYDHTTNSKLGYYLQAYSDGSVSVGEETSFVSPTYAGKRWGPHCLTFWYYRPGLGVGKISVATRRNGKDLFEWSATRDVGQRWHYGQVNLDKKVTFQIVFLAEKGRSDEHQMAIDDILILNSQCGNPAECNFNDDYCSYSLNDTSDFAWLLGTGRVVNSQLIDTPPLDNSVEGGTYVYADMTSPSLQENQKATLVSEILELSHEQVTCLSFFYFIQGTDPSTLAVGKMVLNNNDKNMAYQTVELKNFNKTTSVWTQYTMNVATPVGESYQFFFSAVRGAKPRAFIALDDVFVQEGSCPEPTTIPPVLPTEMPVTKISCDFDKNNFCSWSIDRQARLKWQIYDPQKPRAGLPRFDKTKGNYLGRYAYLQGDDVSEKQANITSQAVDENWKGKFCFSFWYIMDVEGPNSLTVYAEHASSYYATAQFVPFWSRQGNYGYKWRHAYVYVNSVKPKPRIRITGSLRDGVIAVDDVEARGGECPPTKMCTFDGEEDMCGFTQDSQNTRDWDVVKGEDDAVMYKFPDHSMQSVEGSFLYIGFNGTSNIRHQSRIYSTRRPPSPNPSCVTFYYHIYNASQLALDTYIATSGGLSDPQWIATTSQGLLWHGARFDAISTTVSWQIMFEASTDKYGYGQVAIDDIMVESGKCPAAGYCDFEQENCLWENVRPPFKQKSKQILEVMNADVTKDLLTDDFDWKRHIGSDYFGPPEDHTLGSPQGFYMILDPRNMKENQKAIMVSERLMFPNGGCLKLWYATPNYKNGASLQVFMTSDFKTADQIKLIKDITSEEWKQVLITVIPTPVMDSMFTNFWIFLAGFVGNNTMSYMAIDDISIDDVVCQDTTELFNCNNGQHVLMTDVCDFHNDCANGLDEANCADCDFETNHCGWAMNSDVPYYWFKWIRSQAGREGLPYDHTKQDASGYFMIAAATRYMSNYNAGSNLTSAVLRNAFSTCSLVFWYNIFGNVTLTMTLTRNDRPVEVWIQEYSSNQVWTQAEVLITRIPTTFKLTFVAVRDRNDAVHVAIDDVATQRCVTPTSGGSGQCGADMFNCKNSRCVPMENICDYTDDCGNFEDERQETCAAAIGRCSFDRSYCNWIPDSSTTGKFVLQEPFPSLNQGPTRDHTTGTALGKFLFLAGRIRPTPARILGPILQPQQGCQMRFSFDIRGAGPLYLQVKTRTESNGDETVVWSREDPTEGFFFVQDQVNFDKLTKSFQVIIESSIAISKGKVNYVALDDISFNYKCVPQTFPLPTLDPQRTTLPPEKTCQPSEFSCLSKSQCIPLEQKCDFKIDCDDGSDEDHCGKCDFHNDMCGLVNTAFSNYQWRRVQADVFSLSKNSSAPDRDSQGNKEGFFAVLSGKKYVSGFNIPTVMRTPVLGATSHSCALQFFYHFNIRDGYLKVFLTSLGFKQERFSVTKNTGKTWQFAYVPIGNYAPGKRIEYHGFTTYEELARQVQDIAIDNINYVHCDPNDIYLGSINCTFDLDECGWYPDNNFTLAIWMRAKSFLPFGPKNDHTGKGGYFMYLKGAAAYSLKGDKAHLVAPRQNSTAASCFTFWYHMFGQDVGTLNIIVRTDQGNSTVWSKSDSQGNAWKQGMRTIKSSDPYSIVIEGIFGAYAKPVIAIDDVEMYDGKCPHAVACDFEADYCDWTYSGFGLQVGQGNNPSKDHTTGTETGSYAALTVNNGRLISPEFYYSKPDYCLNFWYFLEGDRSTQLKVQKWLPFEKDWNLKYVNVWADTAEINIKGQWMHASAKISDLSGGDLYVQFNGSRNSTNGVVALDDVSLDEGACPPYGSCTFEKDFCTWRNLPKPISTGLRWLRNSGSIPDTDNGPQVDHTIGTPEGWYIYMDGNFGQVRQKAVLESEILPYGPTACFKFWYHMYGWGSGSLEVVYVNHTDNKIYDVMKISGSQGRNWYPVKRPVTGLPPFYKIRFIGTRGQYGDLALDDILIQEGGCADPVTTTAPPTEFPPTPWDCDFETGDECLWSASNAWLIQDGKRAIRSGSGPTRDHTRGDALGYYAYYYPQNNTGNDLISPEIPTGEDDYCFKFWYYMHSTVPIALEMHVIQYNNPAGPIWMKKTSAGSKWKYGTYYFQKSANISVVFKGKQSKLDVGDIALDDFSFNVGRCPILKGVPCDFESDDICGFQKHSPDGVSWKRIQAKAVKQVATYGPLVDKTYGTAEGHYMLVLPTVGARVPGDNVAHLIMKDVPETGPLRSCVQFWYQMAGANVNALSVYMRPSGGPLPQFPIWTHGSKHGNSTWRVGQTTVEADYKHEIVFEAKVDKGNNGFIALDEVVVKEGQCPPPASCNFEADLCTWQNAEKDVQLEWVRNTGPTPTDGTGPDVDHTLGTDSGSYVYLQGANPEGDVNLFGILQSEFLSLSTERCLSFWAHMSGSEMGTLSVNLSYYDETGLSKMNKESWNIIGDQGPKWFNRLININIDGMEIMDEYQILFIGRTKGNLSDIALDDIEVTPQKCYEVIDDGFDCRDGTFVGADEVCDFEKNCANGEDEINCGECDFEHGDCQWRDITNRWYEPWTKVKGKEGDKVNGPGYDHTFNTSAGSFMIVDTTTEWGWETAVLQSPSSQFKKSYASCVMKFYYVFRPDYSSTLRVRKRLESSTEGSVWEESGIRRAGWQLGTAYLGVTERPFFVEFVGEATRGRTYVAIDDITFENCSMPEKRVCNLMEFSCNNSRCVSNFVLCDRTDDCGDGSDEASAICSKYPKSCTFDSWNDDCEWTAQGKAKNKWSVYDSKSSRSGFNSGPLVDHTKGVDNTGRFLGVKRYYNDYKNYRSYYYSPTYIVSEESYCALRFYYYMYSEVEDMELKVHTDTELNGWNWKQRFSERGSLGQVWSRAVIVVQGKDPFYFIIDGNPGNTTSSIIGVDDITLSLGCKGYDGDLPTPASTALPTVSTCKETEFTCKYGYPFCIPKDKKCDFTADCQDGSDEEACGPCDFWIDFCGWDNRSPGKYSWGRKNASSLTEYGPNVDYLNSTQGWYAYVGETWSSYYVAASLVSPLLPPTSSHCVMVFWLYRSTQSSGQFYVSQQDPYIYYQYRLWTAPTPKANEWVRYEVKLRANKDRGSTIRFNSLPEWGYYTKNKSVALDAIRFMNCNPKDLPVDCDFDDDSFNNGMCHWINGNAFLQWKRGNGSTSSNFTGPTSDHTTGHGYYLYIETPTQPGFRMASLDGPMLPMNSPEGSCFTFWYHMYGQHVGTLQILHSLSFGKLIKWAKSRSQGNKWHFGEVNIVTERDYYITITANTITGTENNIAIDDLKMIDGPCPQTSYCDFENGFCGWNASYEGSSGWNRTQGSGNWSDEKPMTDHTTGTENGYFIVLPYKKKGDLARIESPLYKNYGDMCVKFYYSMFGNDIGSLAVYQRTTQEGRIENLKSKWKRSGDHVGGWKLGRVTLKSLPEFYIAIEAQTSIGPLGYIALDDIHLVHGKCSDPASCNFEIDSCGWSNSDAFADIDWIRRTGLDQNMGEGPTGDHSLGNVQGHYMYAYLTGLPAESQTMLISEDLEISPNYCLTFWFNMYNTVNSSLLVQQVLIGMGWEGVSEYESSDVASNEWVKSETNITVEDAGDFFQIGLTAMTRTVQDNYTSRGIAIDDLSLVQQKCGEPITTTTLPPTTTTAFPPSRFDCTFETDFCLWTNDADSSDNSAMWEIKTGHSNRTLTRPRTDHTTLSTSGHYLTINDNGKRYYFDRAILISKNGIDPNSGAVCFKFWYHIYGNNPGQLLLKLRDFNDEDKFETIWSRAKSQGPDWKYEQIHIVKKFAYRFLFEGDGTNYGDISLDDFSLNYGDCPPRDFCDVEQDYCGFSRDPEGDFQWHRGNGSKTNGPDVDHTLGTSQGNYFYVNNSAPVKEGQVARLESGAIPPEKRCMQFFYYLYGIDVGTLEVLVHYGEQKESKWVEKADYTEFWHGSEVVLAEQLPLDYSYIFQVTAGSAFKNGTIAIDDISILTECPPLGSCNFEESMCLWSNDPDTELQWMRGSGEITDSAPPNDTTIGNQFGTYLYVHIVNQWEAQPRPARLISPYFHSVPTRCINYWNFRNGTEFNGELSMYIYDDVEDEITAMQHFGRQNLGRWVNEQVEIDREEGQGKYQIIFEAELAPKLDNFIAIDDITIYDSNCEPLEDIKPDYVCDRGNTRIPDDQRCDFYEDCKDGTDELYCGLECDFETVEPNPCYWSNVLGGDASWNQTLANASQEPESDHTKNTPGEGRFMMVNFNKRFKYSGYAHFLSPALIQSAPTCKLFFWYYFSPVNKYEDLSIFYDSGHVNTQTRIWHMQADLGRLMGSHRWKLGTALVGRIEQRFRVGFTGYKGSLTSIIAIDDLNFEDCDIPRLTTAPDKCKDEEFMCKNGNCISSDLLCDFVDDCGDYSDENRVYAKCESYPGRCNFEGNNFCSWGIGKESDYEWKVSKPDIDSSLYWQVLASRDHTQNSANGRFIYASTYYKDKGEVCRLASKVMEAKNETCKFRFFYTYGTEFNNTNYEEMRDIGTLSVYIRRDQNNVWKVPFTVREPPGQFYEKVVIPLGEIKEPFEVIIEAKVGTSPRSGGWAVDDVSFTPGCIVSNESLPLEIDEPTDAPVEKCKDTEFLCVVDRNCIRLEQVCDFAPDCSDSSDEVKCGTCDFNNEEYPMCGWTSVQGGRWKRRKGPYGNNGLISDADKDGDGYYIHVNKDRSGPYSSEADLRSVDFHEASAACEIQFYYFMSGIKNFDASLKLYLHDYKTDGLPLWYANSDQGRTWQNATVSIGKREKNWRLDFTATHVLSEGDIALDDIQLINCAPPEKRKCANKNEFPCLSGECINNTLLCDFSPDCPDGSDEDVCDDWYERCDFESGNICGWTQSDEEQIQWVVTSGKKLTEGVGPSRDHTTQTENGKFLMARYLRHYWNEPTAKIRSTSFFADTSGKCKIRFWAHLYESYTSKIIVNKVYVDDDRLRPFYNVYGSSGDEWQRIEVPLSSVLDFHVVLEAQPTYGSKGEVAIDDISFTRECIPVYTVVTTPIPTQWPKGYCEQKGQFACDDYSCVPYDVICDFKTDCPYGADERNCPSFCDFEIGSKCGWKALTEARDGMEINVTIAGEAYKITPNAPKVDKTTNTSDGSYLIMHAVQERDTGADDEYLSPTFRNSATACKFSFWYASYTFVLKPSVTFKTPDFSVDMISIDKSSSWSREEMGIGRQKGNFTISVNRKGGMRLFDYVALDDIEFTNCALPKRSPAVDCKGFMCNNLACIDYFRVCDLMDDCGDASDENNCAQNGYTRVNFENGYEFFYQSRDEVIPKLMWRFMNGTYPNHQFRRVGPPFDHTLSSPEGRYLGMTSYPDGAMNEKAWLISHVFRSLSMGKCEMRFYYFMYGKYVNQLNIYTRNDTNRTLNRKWTQTGEVGNFWMRGKITINDTAPFVVIIEGKAGVESEDMIAIDDISFSNGCDRLDWGTLPPFLTTEPGPGTSPEPNDCRDDQFACATNKTCIPAYQKCDFRDDCGDGSDEKDCVKDKCNFNNGDLCGWDVTHKYKNSTRFKRDEDSAFRWLAIRANDSLTEISRDYRPTTDHSSNATDGWYLLAEGTPGRRGDVTALVSPVISDTHSHCALDFWLYCGKFSCSLKVYAAKEGTNPQPVWDAFTSLFGMDFTQRWIHAKVLLDARQDTRVRFETVRPYDYKFAVCLDDIKFENCPPARRVDPEDDTCSGGEMMCGNQRCIEENLRCDFKNDCGDGSDERDFICHTYNGRCNFEGVPCNDWILEPDGSTAWKVQSAMNSIFSNVPNKDHTTDSSTGKYLAIIPTFSAKNAKPAIRSKTLDALSKDCKVRFWYNTVFSQHTINIYKRISYSKEGMEFLIGYSSDVFNYWHRVEFPVLSGGKDFQIVLEAQLASTFGSISIDDISLTPGCLYTEGRDLPGNPTVLPPVDDCWPDRISCKNKNCYVPLQRCNFIDDCGDNSDEENCGTSCDFENGMCGWYNPVGFRGNWTINSGKKPFTSLSVDHTKNSEEGHYLSPDVLYENGDLAQIHTEPYMLSASTCKFSMWYWMDGYNARSLHIILLHSKSANKYEEKWVQTKPQGKGWNKASVDIGVQENFAVVVQAMVKGSFMYSIAVDDILFEACAPVNPPIECRPDEFMCDNKEKCIKGWAKCDGKFDCKDQSDEVYCPQLHGDCTFEDENWMTTCSWTSKKLEFDWERRNKARNDLTGPDRNQDPTSPGHFLLMDSSQAAEGDRAGVMTPFFNSSEGKCHLRFWYFMKGSQSIGPLEVRSEGEQGFTYLVFNTAGPKIPKWQYVHKVVGNLQRYRISFIATRGKDDLTDIAIDEVRFTAGCEEGGDLIISNNTGQCYRGFFQCKSGDVPCVPTKWRCDCAPDCEDGSDEFNCGFKCLSTQAPKTLPPTGPTTPEVTRIPQADCKEKERACSDGTCIKAMLVCDGVPDCPDKSDEIGCDLANLCEVGFYFCADQRTRPCLSRDFICNGIDDCTDGSDESLCGVCIDNYCQNGGNCSFQGKVPVCSCPPEYKHNRCAKKVETPEQENNKNFKGSGVGWIIGVVVGTILLIAIMFIIWYKRNTNAERSRLAHAVDNPVYGLNLDTLTFGELNSHMPVRSEDGAGATAIENPLYAFQSEIK